jgi:2-keto-4-pentenoate hydratase
VTGGAWTDPRVAEGMRAQVAARGAAAGIGWKIGMNSAEFQRKVGLDGSLVGWVPGPPISTVRAAGAVDLRVEPEVAVCVGTDLGVASIAPALEVVDLDGPLEEISDALAGNIFHRAVAFGAWVPPAGSTSAGEGVLTINGTAAVSTGVAAGLDDVVRYVAEYLSAFGLALRPGDRIITGTLAPPPAVVPGDRVVFDAGALGSVSVEFAA